MWGGSYMVANDDGQAKTNVVFVLCHWIYFWFLSSSNSFSQELGGALQILSAPTKAQTSSCPFFLQNFGFECLHPIVLFNVSSSLRGRLWSLLYLLRIINHCPDFTCQ
jgi:hypothetical protein